MLVLSQWASLSPTLPYPRLAVFLIPVASYVGPVCEVTMEQVRNAFELNTFAAVRVSNAVIPSMVKRHEGLIINIGSIAGLM